MAIGNQKPLSWMDEALKYNGLREVKGPRHNKFILKWLRDLGAWWSNDEVPWCGVFVAARLKNANRNYPRHWYRAKAYAKNYGKVLNKPAYGCLAVKSRRGGGHVFFVAGITKSGRIVGYGGNQSDKVCYATFNPADLTYIWPEKKNGTKVGPYPSRYRLPVFENNLKPSTKES